MKLYGVGIRKKSIMIMQQTVVQMVNSADTILRLYGKIQQRLDVAKLFIRQVVMRDGLL